ncbi:MAG: hypothetical protein IJG63_07475, partial [Oscillospiraceae bacterium]|nr:hypothetical protein [Oscillospiraceae bacterium]
ADMEMLERIRRPAIKALDESRRFAAGPDIGELMGAGQRYISRNMCSGESWLTAGQITALYKRGVKNAICVQSFGCVPSHIAGKGVIKNLSSDLPGVNIITIDYDPSASQVNQLNRIRLMITNALKMMREEEEVS